MAKLSQLSDYFATRSEGTEHYCSLAIQLTIESDASYLLVSSERSCVARYFYLSSYSKSTIPTSINDAIHVFCHMMPEVLLSDNKAELGTLFYHSKESCPLQAALNNMRLPQAPKALFTNSCSKAIDVHFYWVRHRVCQGQSTVNGKKGKRNVADYFTNITNKMDNQSSRTVSAFFN
jgi:hypothetical protein